MPIVYLKNDLYNRIVKADRDVSKFVNEAVEEKLKEGMKNDEKE